MQQCQLTPPPMGAVGDSLRIRSEGEGLDLTPHGALQRGMWGTVLRQAQTGEGTPPPQGS